MVWMFWDMGGPRLVALMAGLMVLMSTLSLSTGQVGAQAPPTRPAVTAVAVAANPAETDFYTAGDTISVSLTFDQTVVVTGTPYVVVDVGGTKRNAGFQADGGREASVLTFAYGVVAGESDGDGIEVDADSLNLNGGSITSQDGTLNAVLSHEAASPGNTHRVDAVRPTVEFFLASSTHLQDTGFLPVDADSLLLILFSEPVTALEDADFSVTNASLTELIQERGTGYADGRYWSALVSPAATGAVTVDLADGAAADAAGNSNTAATRLNATAANPDIVTISAAAASVSEDGTPPAFRIVRSPAAGTLTVQVNVSVEGDFLAGTTSFGATITTAMSTQAVSFDDGVSSRTIQFDLTNDGLHEPNGSLAVAVAADPNVTDYVAGSPGQAIVILTDDDDPVYVELRALQTFHNNTVWEGQSVLYQILRSDSHTPLTMRMRLTETGDVLSPGELPPDGEFDVTIPGTTRHIVIDTVDDDVSEVDGTLTLEILPLALSSGHVIRTGSATATVRDNDVPPTVSIAAVEASVTEGEGAEFSLGRTSALGESTGALTVTVRLDETGDTLGGTVLQDTQVVFPSRETSVVLTVATLDDMSAEADSSLTARVSVDGDGKYLVGTAASATVVVVDNEPATYTITADAAEVTEGSDAVFTVTRTGSSYRAQTVRVRIEGHRKVMTAATAAMSFAELQFAAGATAATLRLTTAPDNRNEGDGSIQASLVSNPGSSHAIGNPNYAEVRVKDDDIPEFTFHVVFPEGLTAGGSTWTGNMAEGNRIRFEMRCPAGMGYALPFPAVVSHDHAFNHPNNPSYNHSSRVLVPCNQEVHMPIDELQTYTGPDGGQITAELLSWETLERLAGERALPAFYGCREDDFTYCPRYVLGDPRALDVRVYNLNPTIVVAAIDDEVTEGGTARFVLTRYWEHPGIFSDSVIAETRVGYRVNQTGDFVAAAATGVKHGDYFTWTVRRYTVEVATTDDDVWSADGSVTLELLPDTFAAQNIGGQYELFEQIPGITPAGKSSVRATVRVRNNDALPIISIADAAAGESAGAAEFAVSLDRASNEEIVVEWRTRNGTAVAGVDYTASAGTLTFTPGTTAASIEVFVIDNDLDQPDRTFEITLFNPVNAAFAAGASTVTGVGTIRDDDLPVVTIAAKPARVVEGSPVVFVLRRAGQTTGSLSVSVPVTLNGEGIDAGLAGTIAAGNDSVEVTLAAAHTPADDMSVGDVTQWVFEARLSESDAGGQWTPGDPDRATVTVYDDDVERGLNLAATASPTSFDAVGDEVTLSFTVLNIGNAATMGTVAVGTSKTSPATACSSASVAAGGEVTCSTTYTTTQTDVEAGSVVFAATATDSTTTSNVVTLTVPYEPTAVVGMAENRVSVEEDAGSVNVTVTLSKASEQTVTVDYTTAAWVPPNDQDSTKLPATSGADFTANAGTLTFTAGQTSKTVTVVIVDDAIHEPRERFNLELSNPRYAKSGRLETLVTIHDNDAAMKPELWIESNETDPVTEGGRGYEFAVRLSRASGHVVTMTAATYGNTGTATRGRDYLDIGTQMLRLQPGEVEKLITVLIVEDVEVEGDETFPVDVSSVQHATVRPGTGPNSLVSRASGTIVDNDETPATMITLSATLTEFTESDGAQTVEVTATFDGAVVSTATTVRVSEDETPGSLVPVAAAPGDFERVTPFDVIIPPGATTGSTQFTFTLLDDAVYEREEIATFEGQVVEGGEVVQTGLPVTPFTITIEDNDDRGSVVTPTSLTIEEGASSHYTVVLKSEPETNVVLYVDPSEDTDAVTVSPSNLTFTPSNWDGTQTIEVSAVEDSDIDDAHVLLSHRLVGGFYSGLRADTVAVNINDTTFATVSVNDASAGENDGQIVFQVSLDPAAGEQATVEYSTVDGSATAGMDYVEASGTLTFALGVTEGSVTVQVTEDALDERNEDFSLALASPSSNIRLTGGQPTLSAVGTIQDNDPLPVLAFDTGTGSSVIDVNEDAGATDFKVTLTPPSGLTVTVDYEAAVVGFVQSSPAVIGVDYQFTSGTLRFAPGETEKTLSIQIVDDQQDEIDEYAAVVLRRPVDASFGEGSQTTEEVIWVRILDNDTARVAVVPVALTVEEGDAGGDHYTVALGSQPTDNVTVTVGGHADTDLTVTPTALTFGADDWSTAQTVTVTAAQDEDGAADSVTLTHSAAGGDYGGQGVTASLPTVTVTVRDDDTRGVSVVPTTLTIPEGAAAPYTVALLTRPTGEVRVNVSGQSAAVRASPLRLAFSPDDWETAQTVIVTALQDDDAVHDTVTLVHRTLGGDYGGNDVTAASVTVMVQDSDTDTDMATTDSTAVSLSVLPGAMPEASSGQAVVVTATLNGGTRGEATEIAVTVGAGGDGAESVTDYGAVAGFTLTIPADTASGTATFTLSPVDDKVDEADETLTVGGTVDGGVGLNVLSVELTITDDDERGVAVAPTALTVDEGGSAAYTVVLESEPTETVTVSVTRTRDRDVTVGSASLTFTASDWDVAQTVRVSAGEDGDAANGTATMVHGVSSSGDYDGETADWVTVTERDNDTASTAVSLRVLPAVVPEASSGQAVVVTGRLNGGTRGEATEIAVTVGAGRDGAKSATDYGAVAGFTLTIPADTASGTATFTLSPVGDKVDEADESVTVGGTVAGGGLNVLSAELTITDDDERGVAVTPTALTVDEGGSAAYTVVLESEPTETVTVSVTRTRDRDVTVGSASLTFTASDWDVAQTVRVSAGEDGDAANGTATMVHGVSSSGDYDGETADWVTVTERDNDTASTAVTLRVSPGVVPEASSGQAVVVTGRLNGGTRGEATEIAVTVGAGRDGAESATDYGAVAGFTLTIPADTASGTATFTLSPVGDKVDEADESVTVGGTVAGGGLNVLSAELTITDDDERGVAVAPTALTVDEGGSAAYTVVLESEPTETVRVSVSRTGDRDVTVGSASLTFTASDWDVAQTVRVSAGEDGDAANGTATMVHGVSSSGDYDGEAAASVTVTERDNDTASTSVTLSVLPGVVPEASSGQAVVVTGRLNGGTRGDATEIAVTVGAGRDGAKSATDYGAVAGFRLTIPADTASGTATFTLSPVDDKVDEADESVTVGGTVAGGGLNVLPAELTITDDDERGVAVTPTALTVDEGGSAAYTVVLESEPTETVTVSVTRTRDRDVTVGSASLTFTASDWEVAQTVRVSAGEDGDAANGTATMVHGVSSSGDYGGEAADSVTVTERDSDTASTAVSLSVLPGAVPEASSGQAVVVTGRLNGGTRGDATEIAVTVGAGRDGAKSATDYRAVAGFRLTIPADTASGTATFTLSPVGDKVDEADESVTVGGTVAGGGLNVLSAELTITDDDERGVAVTPTALTVDEGGSAAYTVVLESEPTETVTVSVTRTRDRDVTVGSASLTFTASDWDVAQTVRVSAGEDGDAANGTATMVHGVSSSGDYDGETADWVTVTERDNDTASTAVSLRVLPAVVPEASSGQAVVVTGRLNGGTRGDATEIAVTVGAGRDGAKSATDYRAVAGFRLTIPADTASGTATFTLSPVGDKVDEADESVTVGGTVAGGGLNVLSAELTITDDDERGVAVTPTALTVDEGGSAAYTVVLESEPTETVTVSVSQDQGQGRDGGERVVDVHGVGLGCGADGEGERGGGR